MASERSQLKVQHHHVHAPVPIPVSFRSIKRPREHGEDVIIGQPRLIHQRIRRRKPFRSPDELVVGVPCRPRRPQDRQHGIRVVREDEEEISVSAHGQPAAAPAARAVDVGDCSRDPCVSICSRISFLFFTPLVYN